MISKKILAGAATLTVLGAGLVSPKLAPVVTDVNTGITASAENVQITVNHTIGKAIATPAGVYKRGFKFTVSKSGLVKFHFSGPYSNMSYDLQDANSNSIYETKRGGLSNKEYYYYHLKKGTYTMYVTNFDYQENGYSFNTSLTSAKESFAETGKDNTKAGANLIKLNKSYRGQLSQTDKVDYYKVKVTSATGVKFIVQPGFTGSYTVTIVDAKGREYDSETYHTGSYSKKLRLPKGTYFVCVKKSSTSDYNTSTNGNYILKTVTYNMNQSIKVSKSKIYGYYSSSATLTAKVTKGDGKITYKSSNSNVASVSSYGYLSFNKPGKAVITVKASGTDAYRPATKKITVIVKPGTPYFYSTSKVYKTDGYANLYWSSVTGADGYVIKYASNSSFKNAGTKVVSGASNTHTKIYGSWGASKYYFKIVAYKYINGVKVYGKAYTTHTTGTYTYY